MRKLYVCDLDGTLLDGGAALAAPQRERLNALLRRGLPFTVASARSHFSATKILAGIEFSLPLILMNGSILYDWGAQKIARLTALSPEDARLALEICLRHGLAPVAHSIDREGHPRNSYTSINPGPHDRHYGGQLRAGDPRFRRVESYRAAYEEEQCLSVGTLAEKEALEGAIREMREAALPFGYYDDVYTGGRFLECMASDKGRAARALKEELRADCLVAIGDNLNDLPMLRLADRAVVVSDGHPEAIAAAHEVIGPCSSGGVLDFLEREMGG